MTTAEGRFFIVEVEHEVILDQEHRIKPGVQDYVRYECWNDFPDRIETLSTADQVVNMEPAPSAAAEAPQAVTQDTHEQSAPEADAFWEPESETEPGRAGILMWVVRSSGPSGFVSQRSPAGPQTG